MSPGPRFMGGKTTAGGLVLERALAPAILNRNLFDEMSLTKAGADFEVLVAG